MKTTKIVLALFFGFLFNSNLSAQGNLNPIYNNTKIGLDYVQKSVLLGQRYDFVGIDYFGLQQPTALIISGIPTDAVIEKAYLWWEHYGVDSSATATLESPSGSALSFSGTLIATDNDFCWGPQRGFRADVTSIVEGNGTYNLSGLKTNVEAKDTLTDTDGATLMIIYSDQTSTNYGCLTIRDGFVKAETDTLKLTVPVSPSLVSNTGKAFMIITDMEYYYDAKISMNGGSYYSPGKDFWDFEQKNTTFSVSQPQTTFGLKPGVDCAHVLAVGTHLYVPVDSVPVALVEKVVDFDFSLYPNPTSNRITVVAPKSGKSNVSIFDMYGKLVIQRQFENRVTVDLSGSPSGIYFVSVENKTKKLILTGNNSQ